MITPQLPVDVPTYIVVIGVLLEIGLHYGRGDNGFTTQHIDADYTHTQVLSPGKCNMVLSNRRPILRHSHILPKPLLRSCVFAIFIGKSAVDRLNFYFPSYRKLSYLPSHCCLWSHQRSKKKARAISKIKFYDRKRRSHFDIFLPSSLFMFMSSLYSILLAARGVEIILVQLGS